MRRLMRSVVLLLGVALSGCAAGGTPFNEAAASLAPIPAGAARIFVYRDFAYYQGLDWVPVLFNGQTVGAVGPGQVIMRDVAAPGTYRIEAASQGLWPDQEKTVAVQPGQTVYAKVESFKSLDPSAGRPVLQITYVVVLQDTATGRREIDHLRLMASVDGEHG